VSRVPSLSTAVLKEDTAFQTFLDVLVYHIAQHLAERNSHITHIPVSI